MRLLFKIREKQGPECILSIEPLAHYLFHNDHKFNPQHAQQEANIENHDDEVGSVEHVLEHQELLVLVVVVQGVLRVVWVRLALLYALAVVPVEDYFYELAGVQKPQALLQPEQLDQVQQIFRRSRIRNQERDRNGRYHVEQERSVEVPGDDAA